jgi:hypothetical protein
MVTSRRTGVFAFLDKRRDCEHVRDRSCAEGLLTMRSPATDAVRGVEKC